MNVIRVPKDSSAKLSGLAGQTVYRILRFEHLVRLFKDGEYALVSPFSWEDPFEKLWSQLVFRDKLEHEQLVRRVFGSCLTFEARSDAMWNIYSRNWLGVRVTMRLDELQRQVEAAAQISPGRVWFGEVNYLKDVELTRKAIALKQAVGGTDLDRSEAIAKAWLNKRIAFRHEDEIRMLLVLPEDKALDVACPVFKFSVDPYALVKSIHIDPRAPRELVDTLQRDIRSNLGFKGSIRQSSLLRLPPALEALLPSPLADLS